MLYYWVLRGSCGKNYVFWCSFTTAMFDDLWRLHGHLVRWMWLQTAGCYADGVGGSRMVAEVPLHQTFNLELWLEVWRICNENQCSVLFASVLCLTRLVKSQHVNADWYQEIGRGWLSHTAETMPKAFAKVAVYAGEVSQVQHLAWRHVHRSQRPKLIEWTAYYIIVSCCFMSCFFKPVW